MQSAQAGLTLLKGNEKIDMIVTDVMMPEVNGYELAQTVFKEYPDVHMIILSGQCSAQDRAEFEKLVLPFFEKPVSIMDLTETISKLVNDNQ